MSLPASALVSVKHFVSEWIPCVNYAPKTKTPCKKPKMCLPASPVASIQHSVDDLKRPYVNYAPDIWGDIFLRYASESNKKVNDNVKQLAQSLKEEVKALFHSSINVMQKLDFIDLVQRFGLSYHFQEEINQALEQTYNTFNKSNTTIEDDSLHCLALLFRLLRQQGYKISADIFNKFKNEQGNFNEALANDIQGLCSLYEATHLRTHDDVILEEAYQFSKFHLKSLENQLSSSLAAQINQCLRRPHNKSVVRYEARYHMTIYEQDPSHDKTLLTFAKVDFYILQKLHQQEIASITKQWNDSNIVKTIPFTRHRLVESYLWSLAMSYKPEHSKGRMLTGKWICIYAVIDDVYDAYGTMEELELFTKAIQRLMCFINHITYLKERGLKKINDLLLTFRWDNSLIGSLPQYMKVFDTVAELIAELELVTTESGKSSFVVPFFKQTISDLVKGFMVERKWLHEGYFPTYDEYKVNGRLTFNIPTLIAPFIGSGEFATKDVFDWINSGPNIIEAVSIIGRLLDDLSSHKLEQQRVHAPSSVECYMKQYGKSQEEAYNFIEEEVEECWKVINEECLKLYDLPEFVLDCIANLVRSFEFFYVNRQDNFTNGELLKDHVTSLFVNPICIDQHE